MIYNIEEEKEKWEKSDDSVKNFNKKNDTKKKPIGLMLALVVLVVLGGFVVVVKFKEKIQIGVTIGNGNNLYQSVNSLHSPINAKNTSKQATPKNPSEQTVSQTSVSTAILPKVTQIPSNYFTNNNNRNLCLDLANNPQCKEITKKQVVEIISFWKSADLQFYLRLKSKGKNLCNESKNCVNYVCRWEIPDELKKQNNIEKIDYIELEMILGGANCFKSLFLVSDQLTNEEYEQICRSQLND